MNKLYLVLITFVVIVVSSCATTTSVSFLCNQEDLQIYINDEYVGNGLVNYIAPKGVTTAEVECKKDGLTVFSRNYYIKGHNRELFDIVVPNYNSYSSDKIIHSK